MNLNPYILIITTRESQLKDFSDRLADNSGLTVSFADSFPAALEKTAGMPPKMAVVDSTIGDGQYLDFIKNLLEKNAFIGTAVLSGLSDEEFHHVTEGLGISMRLPVLPGKSEAEKLLSRIF